MKGTAGKQKREREKWTDKVRKMRDTVGEQKGKDSGVGREG